MHEVVIVLGAEPNTRPVLDIHADVVLLTPSDIIDRTEAAVEAGMPILDTDMARRLLDADARERTRRAQVLTDEPRLAAALGRALAKTCMPAQPSDWRDMNQAPRSYRRR